MAKEAKTFKIEESIHARIKLLAAMKETTLSNQVEKALLAYLDDNNVPDKRSDRDGKGVIVWSSENETK